MTDALRVVIFAAKSTADDKGSIPDQIKACGEHANEQGWIIDSRESDEAASAYSGNRGPGLERAMEQAAALAEKHGRAGLLVWHSNRLARGGGDAPGAAKHLAEYVFWANRANVEIHSVHDDYTFSNPILAMVMGQMAHEESKIKAANVRKGMERRRAKGLHTGGRLYGYDPDPDLGLRPNPEQAATVERIFRMIASGKSQAETARILNKEGVRPLRSTRGWQQASISALIQHRKYLGETQDSEGNWIDAKHEAIITPELFDAANTQREGAAAKKGRGGGPRTLAGHLLTGRMLRHATCGEAMTPRSGDQKKDGTVSGWYECSGAKTGICSRPPFRVAMPDVDATISQYLAEVGIDVAESLRVIRAAAASREQSVKVELESARKEAAKAEADWQRIRRDYREGNITAQDWAEFRTELESEKAAAVAKLERLEARATEGDASPEVIVPAVANALELVRAAMKAGDTDTVRSALEALFEEFLVGEASEVPEEAIVGSPEQMRTAKARVREQVAAMEAKGGRTVAEANEEFWQEELSAPWPEALSKHDPLDVGLTPSDGLVILPMPREDALASVIENGRPVYLVDDEGRSAFKRLPFGMTNNDGLQR